MGVHALLVLCAYAAAGQADTEWPRWVVVSVCPTRIYRDAWKSDAKRLKLIRDFDPDVCDWWSGVALNPGGFFAMRGVASSSPTEYEYQEAIGPMWGFARKLFSGNGMAIRENGHWARFPKTKYGGARMMCLNAPKWRMVVEQGMVRAAGLGDAVTQDNIGAPVDKYHPGFCDWCSRRFVEHLRGRFSAEELVGMGVRGLSGFHLRRYLPRKRTALGLPFYKPPREGADPEALIRDPIVHEYTRFQFRAMLDVWREFAAATKREARRLGRREPAVYGNQGGCAGQTPLATMLCPHVDVVWIESSRCFQPCFERVESGGTAPRYNEGVFVEAAKRREARQAWSTLLYKVGRAAGHFRKPVWTIHYPEQWYGDGKRTPSEIVFAEAYANGGVPVLLFAPSIAQKADTTGLTWQVNRETAQFVGRRRELFADRSSVADVALVLSLPSVLWRKCTSLRVPPVAHLQCFTAAARQLEEAHVPYDVIVLGHPDFYDDGPGLARLGRYRTVVLPGADCLSATQVEALSTFAEAGGRLVLVGEVGVRDEEMRECRTPAFEDLERVADAVPRPSDGPLVETDLPATVWLNVWRHGAGPMVSVQFVNYDADIVTDCVRSLGSFSIRVRVAEVGELALARYVRPDAEPVDLALTRRGRYAEAKLPGLRVWGTVVFSGRSELAARAAAANARKWLERLRTAQRVAREVATEDLALVREAEGLLAQIQGDAAAPDFASLVKPLQTAAERLRSRVQGITNAETAAAAAVREDVLATNAVRRFDFGEAGATEGWAEVRCDTGYSPQRGYGWVGKARMASADHGAPDPLHRDYLRNTDPATYLDYEARYVGNRQFKRAQPPLHPALFRVDLANGDYVVTVISGSHEAPGLGSAAGEGRTAMTCVDANGVPKLMGERIEPGRFTNRAFRVRVTDGRLDLRFHGSSVGPFFHNTIEWLVNGVVVQRAGQRPIAAAAASLRLTERMAAAALREWTVLGPFGDPDWTGMAREFRPERGGSNAAGKRWRQEADQGVPIVSIGELPGGTGSKVAFAVAEVQCARPRRAVLHFSTSQRGAAFVNGARVHVDNVAVGLMLGEHRVEVNLRAGRNSITIKSVSHWPGEWSVWAALTTPDGEPVGQ